MYQSTSLTKADTGLCHLILLHKNGGCTSRSSGPCGWCSGCPPPLPSGQRPCWSLRMARCAWWTSLPPVPANKTVISINIMFWLQGSIGFLDLSVVGIYDDVKRGPSIWAYLLHVQFNHIGKVSTRFEVAEESSLQGPLVQEVHWVSLELCILVWYTHQNSNTPALDWEKLLELQLVLERNWANNSSRAEHSYNITYIMHAFKCLDHSVDVACALNTAVNTTIGHLSKYLEHHNS